MAGGIVCTTPSLLNFKNFRILDRAADVFEQLHDQASTPARVSTMLETIHVFGDFRNGLQPIYQSEAV